LTCRVHGPAARAEARAAEASRRRYAPRKKRRGKGR
jgi:hypothetical protein